MSNTSSPTQSPHISQQHTFHEATFKRFTHCDVCRLFIYGLRKQGLQCEVCHMKIHTKCANKAPPNCMGELWQSHADITTIGSPHAQEHPELKHTGSSSSAGSSSKLSISLSDEELRVLATETGIAPDHLHSFEVVTLTKFTDCSLCGGFIWGLAKQGSACVKCKWKTHHHCAEVIMNVQGEGEYSTSGALSEAITAGIDGLGVKSETVGD